MRKSFSPSSRLLCAASLLASLLATVTACATNPATGRREFNLMSEGQEVALGLESDPQIRKEMGVYDDAALVAYVRGIGEKMARISERPTLQWRFTIVDQPAINAFAVPGGFIYFTRGILPFLNSEAELAGVMGHEIGHVTARHSAQQYSRSLGAQFGLATLGVFVPSTRPFEGLSAQALGVVFLKYGRDDERQADQLGVRYAGAAGWDPAGVPGMLNTLGRLDEAQGDRRGVPNWLSTHPEPLERVADVQPAVAALKASGSTFSTNRDEYLRQIDGIIYGDNPEQGIVRGMSFLHPRLRFRLEFPDGWNIQNGTTQVTAKAPGAEASMLLEVVQEPNGRTLDEVAVNQMRAAGFRAVSGERTVINGVDAFLGVYQGTLQDLGAVRIRTAHLAHGTSYYLLAGISKADAFPQVDAAFVRAMRSFRPLSAAEAAGIGPNRVDIYVVRAGDTWAGIAERTGRVIPAATLAIMNNAAPTSTPVVGTRIKIVVGG